MKSLVLSSGFGTRLYPLTLTVAKGLLEYRGRPLIDYVIDKLLPDVDILVNVNKKFEWRVKPESLTLQVLQFFDTHDFYSIAPAQINGI